MKSSLRLALALLSLVPPGRPTCAGEGADAPRTLRPKALIRQLFRSNDVVLVGETHGVRRNLVFLRSLVDDLADLGVTTLGYEFGLYEDRAAADALVRSPRFDRDAARRLLFRWDPMWARLEYQQVYETVWRFNRGRAATESMSILPLRYRERYERIRPPPERTDWDAVFHRGDIDAYMAGALEEEVLSKGRKALVYVGREHSWVRYRRRFRVPGSGQWMEQAPSLGHRLSAAHPGRIASVLLHAPLQGAEGGELAPLGGEIEQMARSVGIPFAFDTSGQLGSLPVAESALSTGYDALRLRDLCDGYVVLGTLDSASGCTLDRGFYSRENLPEARRRWKDAARRPYLNTVEDLYRELEDP